jgi:hypothetical protein
VTTPEPALIFAFFRPSCKKMLDADGKGEEPICWKFCNQIPFRWSLRRIKLLEDPDGFTVRENAFSVRECAKNSLTI